MKLESVTKKTLTITEEEFRGVCNLIQTRLGRLESNTFLGTYLDSGIVLSPDVGSFIHDLTHYLFTSEGYDD